MADAQFTKKSLSLAEVLEAAKYAEERVNKWPAWKKEMTFGSLSPPSKPADPHEDR